MNSIKLHLLLGTLQTNEKAWMLNYVLKKNSIVLEDPENIEATMIHIMFVCVIMDSYRV